MQKLTLTDKWDKTFPQDAWVRHEKVTFHNRYGITLAADLYAPKGETGPFAAIAVCGPFGAVKEQSSGLAVSLWTSDAITEILEQVSSIIIVNIKLIIFFIPFLPFCRICIKIQVFFSHIPS